MRWPTAAVLAAACLAGTCAARVTEAEETVVRALQFNRDIRPILADKCYACHGPDAAEREADLRLDDPADAQRDRGGYAVVVPHDPVASTLVDRIKSEDPDMRMPPASAGKELSADEIQRLEQWIQEGAEYAKHWAYVPPTRAPLPAVDRADWSQNPLDRFLLAGLAAHQLQPSPRADRVTLVRRLSFDLTGLPPSPEEVQQFLQDPAPNAWERVVDRLLASPHFGERMASYWLDLVRYANTVGYHGDQEHAIAPYRDWVIAAFNANMPFDRFTREQLAGDLLPDPTLEQRIATGYNRVLQTSHEGGVQVKEYLTKYSADRVRNFGSVWLGSTLACAECHNHKFDPFTQADFYQLAAFFADIDDLRSFQASDTTPTKRDPELIVPRAEDRAEWQRLCAERTDLQRQLSGDQAGPAATAAAALRDRLDTVIRQIAEIETLGRRTMVTETVEPRSIRVLHRGDWMDTSGPIVLPDVPEFLPRCNVGDRRANRLDLANWLVARQNPLTARVLANRLWYLCFGAGLCASLEDFGNQGEEPTYPELLDYLSVELQDHGWDIKRLVRLIVTSEAYRQSSQPTESLLQRDPKNQLFARQGLFRLPAEMVRDSMLSFSGLLVPESGGVASRPYQPEGYYAFLNFPTRTYQSDQDRQQYRRSVYMHWQRQFLHPMLKAFDAPMREECTARRATSNTPLAALTMLNDPSFIEGARMLATRALQEPAGTVPQRLSWMWRRVLSREPIGAELSELLRLHQQERATFAADPVAAKRLVSIGLSPVSADTDPVELAALTSVARAILNLHETITRR